MKHYDLAGGGSIPALGLGTWKSQPGEVGPVIREALRVGCRHFDCAAAYANESEIGEALAAVFAEGDVARDELFVTSKLWNDAPRSADMHIDGSFWAPEGRPIPSRACGVECRGRTRTPRPARIALSVEASGTARRRRLTA